MKWACRILFVKGQFSLRSVQILSFFFPFFFLWVKHVAVVFQHSFEGFCLDTKISKNIYCSLTWSFHQVSWWEGRWLQWSKTSLRLCRQDSLWNTSEQYMNSAEDCKEGIISYFNTKDCLGFFLFKRRNMAFCPGS